jgi:hypothetical protein
MKGLARLDDFRIRDQFERDPFASERSGPLFCPGRETQGEGAEEQKIRDFDHAEHTKDRWKLYQERHRDQGNPDKREGILWPPRNPTYRI